MIVSLFRTTKVKILLVYILLFTVWNFKSAEAQTPRLDSLFNVAGKDSISSHQQILLFEKYLRHYESAFDTLGIMGTKLLIGINYKHLGSFQLSQSYLHEVLSNMLETKDSTYYKETYYTLGAIQIENNNLNLGTNYLRQSLTSVKSLSNLTSPFKRFSSDPKVYNTLAIAYDKFYQIDSAKIYYQLCLNACDKEKDFKTKALALLNSTRNNPDNHKAITLLHEALKYVKEPQDARTIGRIYSRLSLKHMYIGNLDSSQTHLCSARSIFNRNFSTINKDIITIDLIQSEIMGRKGDFKTAFLALRYGGLLKDSLINNNHKGDIKELGFLHELHLKEKEISEKDSNIKRLNYERTIKELQLYGAVGGSIFFIILLILIVLRMKVNAIKRKEVSQIKHNLIEEQLQNKKEQEIRLQNEISLKKKYLTDLATDLSRNYEFTEALLSKVKKLKRSSQKEDGIKDMFTFISKHQTINENLKILWSDLQDFNYEFMENIRAKYPSLSKTDLHLCGMIHLDLSNKEIAAIRNINPKSVRESKVRLRKKLGITGQDDFRGFLIDATT